MSKKEERLTEVTDVKRWRSLREEGVLTKLPSGNVAKIRPVSLAEMIKNGRIPDLLTPIAAEVMADGRPSKETVLKVTNEVTDLLHLVTVASFVEPRVVILDSYEDTPPEGAISIYDVGLDDQSHVLMLALAPTRALQKFRDEQEANVGAVSASEDNSSEA